jgi:hypothetical protein
MNGAELPCGSILSVEPADPNYGKHHQQQRPPQSEKDPVKFGESFIRNDIREKADKCRQPANDDLDEFFDSL